MGNVSLEGLTKRSHLFFYTFQTVQFLYFSISMLFNFILISLISSPLSYPRLFEFLPRTHD